MKILIADSGSTKCDWLLIDEDGGHLDAFSTIGLNPYFHTSEYVQEILSNNEELIEVASEVSHVFFYGAGSSTEHLCSIIEKGLQNVFEDADILVEHDLLGAAYSTYSGEPAITCILGTGSNSCYFDGKEVSEVVPALAYILGDEGSGSYFGKQLLRDYFYKKLPSELAKDFEQEYNLTKDEFVDRVYNQPHANVYLASFMKFVGKHKEHEHMSRMVEKGIADFVEVHVKCYDKYLDMPIHFVGSVGHYFAKELKLVCDKYQLKMGKIVKKPIFGLSDYHVTYKIPSLQK